MHGMHDYCHSDDCYQMTPCAAHDETAYAPKSALITGILGQDGYYLTKFLITKGYNVHGLLRRATYQDALEDFLKAFPSVTMHNGDLCDEASLRNVLSYVQPCEIYNLAAQSHVDLSFSMPEVTLMTNAVGVLRLLEAVRSLKLQAKIYQASTSELYGETVTLSQDEDTVFHPCSPYSIAKQCAFHYIKLYREAYGMFAVNGILFNHESPRRGMLFVTRKTTRSVARIHLGVEECLYLGNLDAKRDWGHAEDYVEAMWLMLQKLHSKRLCMWHR